VEEVPEGMRLQTELDSLDRTKVGRVPQSDFVTAIQRHLQRQSKFSLNKIQFIAMKYKSGYQDLVDYTKFLTDFKQG